MPFLSFLLYSITSLLNPPYFYTPSTFLGASLILTNFYVLKKRLVVPNACDRNHRADICSEIRAYFAVLYIVESQRFICALIKFVCFLPLCNALKSCFSGCKSISFRAQNLFFYTEKAMLLQLKTYVFAPSMLIFDQISKNLL